MLQPYSEAPRRSVIAKLKRADVTPFSIPYHAPAPLHISDEYESYGKLLFYSGNHNQLSQQQYIPCVSKHILSCLTIMNE